MFIRVVFSCLSLFFFAFAGFAEEVETPLGKIKVTKMLEGLDEPWSLGFLPDGRYLVTERGGRLLYIDGVNAHVVSGLPAIEVDGQGGLLDVLIDSDFSQNRRVFLSYNKPNIGTSVYAAELDTEAKTLANGRDIFQMSSPSGGGAHFGGRMVEDGKDYLFLTVGERGERYLAQDLSTDNGTVQHIEKTGKTHEIWSFGHRNPQGAARGLDGEIYVTEHGARGGDELNHIVNGTNYGWPVISYGVNYNGSKIGEGTAKDGMAQPLYYWDPSIAPSGLVIHSGTNWPRAKGVVFIGSLKFDRIDLLSATTAPKPLGAISSEATGRVRDVREGPDGAVWFLSVHNGAVYKFAPMK